MSYSTSFLYKHNGEEVERADIDNICFRVIFHSDTLKNIEYVTLLIDRYKNHIQDKYCEYSLEDTEKYINLLKELGFESEILGDIIHNNKKYFGIKVINDKNPIILKITLTLLRYLYENTSKPIIEEWFRLIEEIEDINKLNLLILAHYSTSFSIYNSNHALVSGEAKFYDKPEDLFDLLLKANHTNIHSFFNNKEEQNFNELRELYKQGKYKKIMEGINEQ